MPCLEIRTTSSFPNDVKTYSTQKHCKWVKKLSTKNEAILTRESHINSFIQAVKDVSLIFSEWGVIRYLLTNAVADEFINFIESVREVRIEMLSIDPDDDEYEECLISVHYREDSITAVSEQFIQEMNLLLLKLFCPILDGKVEGYYTTGPFCFDLELSPRDKLNMVFSGLEEI